MLGNRIVSYSRYTVNTDVIDMMANKSLIGYLLAYIGIRINRDCYFQAQNCYRIVIEIQPLIFTCGSWRFYAVLYTFQKSNEGISSYDRIFKSASWIRTFEPSSCFDVPSTTIGRPRTVSRSNFMKGALRTPLSMTNVKVLFTVRVIMTGQYYTVKDLSSLFKDK